MSDVNVLVVFYSRFGVTERVALAAGVGAIEAEGNIRLRRLPDTAPPGVIDANPAWRAAVDRMHRDYVPPRPADPLWADVIVLATPTDDGSVVDAYVRSLAALGDMRRKVAAPFGADRGSAAVDGLFAAAGRAGLTAVPIVWGEGEPAEQARLHGQRLVRMARALKAAEE